MGIPVFYRWLVDRYPKCVVKAVEDRPVFVNGVRVPVDVTGPNPNGIEYDNLYLDMNGIIHPCFHPEGLPAPTTYDKVFEAMFKYIDKIFSIVRPRKLLFMAIDGVAPRAKMNQQRARRFKAAKEAAEAADGTTLESEEEKPAPLEQPEIDSNVMDSNVITPGTEFMELLSAALRYYIHSRMNEDSGWKGIKVILSDATVAGEGEHKIMSYIRLQRNLPGYDPNTWHCMYGLDADLIMLALATHEINFSILREDGRLNKQNRKYGRRLINQIRKRGALENMPKPSELLDSYIMKLKFQFLNIWVLREYLKHDMEISDPAVKGDLERFVDDFVFLCLFVGNDFLPQIPSLEISEGAINLLLMIYKDEFVKRGGYLTNSFEVNLEHVEHFLHSIGAFEQKIIGQRTRAKNYQSTKRKRPSKSFKLGCNGSRFLADEPETKSGNICSSAKTIKTLIMGDKENPSFRCTSSGRNIVIKKIKLHALDWKERFYVEKFEAKTIDDCERIKKDAAFKYVEGICWVMRYYYQEVCSWQWFYPYHYAPFASDFVNIDQLEIQFTLGEPFKPLDQLLGVLPAASAHALPMAYRKLMTDSSSPILDFYPTDFEVDMEGKRFAWQAVIKLPFIEESRLLFEIAKVEHTLTDEDRKRNTPGLDVLFVHRSHPLAAEINSICQQVMDTSKLTDSEIKQKMDPALSGGMNGYIYISDKPVWPMEIYSPIANLKMIALNDVISVLYKYPSFHSHIPRLPDGVMLPEKIVGKDDLRPLSTIWCSKDAHLLYARKTQAICSIMNSRRNKPKTNFGSCKRQVVQRNEAGYTLRRQLVVNRCTKDNANIVLNCHVKKLKNCDLQKWRKGDGESIPEDALLRLKENKSSEWDQVPCEDNNGNCAEGLKEADREVKHGRVEGVSFRVEKFERYVGEQTDGGAAKKTRDAVEYRNRKLRSKKQKHSDDVTRSNGRKICNFENIEQIKSDGNNGPVADGLEEKMVEIKHSELNGVLCNKRRSEGINAKKTEVGLHADLKNDEVEYNSRGELERGQTKNEGGQPGGFIKWEQTEVDKSRDGMEMETEIRSNKKKKPRSRKRKHSADIVQINDENLKRFCVKEPIENDGGDGVHKDAFKMENSINREQHEEVGLHAAPAGIGEVKTEVKSKKNRKRSREKKYSNSEALSCNNDLEFQSCSNKEQCTVGGHNTVASGVGVLKGVTKSSNLTEGEGLANESSVILGISVFPNQDNKDGDNASVCAFQETRTEVESAADGMKQKTNLEPSNDAMMLSSIRTEHSDGTSSHAAADGLLVKNSEAQPLKRRQKPRLKLKKAKLMEGVSLVNDSSGKLEGSVSQNLNNKDGNDASVCASQETRTEVESADDGMKQKTNLEPSNDAKMLSSIQPEHDEGTSGHTAADRLLVKNSKAQPLRRRQKRRLKKSKLKEVGPLANDSSGKLEGPALLSLNNKDGDNAGVCAFRETRTEAESGVEGMKQKTNLEPSNDAELLSSFQIERSEGISGHAAADGLLVKNSEAQPLIGRKRQGLTSRQRLRLKKQKLMEGEKHRFKEKGMKKDDIDERSLPTSSSPGREKRRPSGYKVKKEGER